MMPMMPGKGGPAAGGMGGPCMMPPMKGMKGPCGMKGMPMMMPMMMRPTAPQQQMQPQMQPPQAQGGPRPLTAADLAAAPPATQKQMLGERLYPGIAKLQPALAGKITGMMLEMDNSELLMLFDSEQQLRTKIDEAIRVLNA